MASMHRHSTARLSLTSPPTAPLRWQSTWAKRALAAFAAASFGACGPEFTAEPPGPGVCSNGQVECQGACVDLATNVDHCGACDRACADSDGSPVCSGGICQARECPANHAECDGDPATECETNLSSDPANCGACKEHCGGLCSQGACIKPIQVAAGANYSCALLSDHTIWCWGKNEWGNLGNGTTQRDEPAPTQVVGLDEGVTQIAVSSSSSRSHTCALLTSGAVQCWGAGANGQLGNGALQNSVTPVPASLPTPAKLVVAGGTHTCALTQANRLYCWGDNGSGQVGDGQTENAPAPALIADNVAAVSAGGEHTCATRNDGSLQCWGNNQFGQLGNGTFQQVLQPQPAHLANGNLIALGLYHSCARTSTPAAVWCWGKGTDFRLGNNSVDPRAEPLALNGLSAVAALALGTKHSGAVLSDGAVVMWGGNTSGQLGIGTHDPLSAPQQIDITSVVSLSLGDDHSCALTTASDVLCWGDNTDGELGDGTLVEHDTPAPVIWQKPAN